MLIEKDSCSGCGLCLWYCPGGAISLKDKKAEIDKELCLECYVCLKVTDCPKGAIKEDPMAYEFPRSVRTYFSDPMAYHKDTLVPGRGTEEVKTNDVTNRVKDGEVGVCIEMGRPCCGSSFTDVEKVTMALAGAGIKFEQENPLTYLMEDKEKGTIKEDVKKQRVVSAIVEFTISQSELKRIVSKIQEIEKELDTVFSLGMITTLEEDGSIPIKETLDELGLEYRPNAKINLGLGRRIS
ncbi:MAG: hypothetical protein VR72_09045 [Clostridiaceae bacterium BRH_c20a]|nr:MAG: hypothetical protein VR72_09045 [Clostridiaceae bacterium BRH_c20a]